MTLIKIALVGAAIIAVMFVGRDQRWFERSGFVGTCVVAQGPQAQPTDTWYSCKQGLLNGFPNLPVDTCTVSGTVAQREIWVCTMPLAVTSGLAQPP